MQNKLWGGVLLFALAGAGLQAQQVRLERVASGLAAPTDIAHAGDGSGRLFIVEKAGRVRILRQGAVLPAPFLDIVARVNSSGGEQGLLGIAFPPDYARKGYFYVNYIDRSGGAGQTVIARYRITGNADMADPASEQIILRIPQPYANHNGGQLAFGPRDGFLYIGMGDGGSAGDPQNNGQNTTSLLGKMLRIDPENNQPTYAVPASNPFVTSNPLGLPPETWARGLRNPWRFAFDCASGNLFIADVGQNRAEEVNFQPASSTGGENYGWNRMEGLRCFPVTANCSQTGFTMPVLEYTRDEGSSVTGGKVYRGTSAPGMRGTYFFADYGSGRLWTLVRDGSTWRRTQVGQFLDYGLSTFGEDEAGEVYVGSLERGEVYRLVMTGPAAAPRLTEAGVVNAASFVAGAAPGSLVSLFGTGIGLPTGLAQAPSLPLPTELQGVRVTMNGVSVPLVAVSGVNGQEQINLQVPFNVSGGTRATVVVTNQGQSSAPIEVPIAFNAPAVFTVDGTTAAALHGADSQPITTDRPARPGEVITLYATGLGPVRNAPPTGAAAPSNPLATLETTLNVSIGGIAATDIPYAGLAPGYVGLYQVNVRVPAGVATGAAEVVLAMVGSQSRTVRVPVVR